MYTIFDKLIDKFKNLDVTDVIGTSISKYDLEFIAELNREQLERGTNVAGDSLGEYSKGTEAYNNQRTTKVSGGSDIKLFDTGALYDSITAELNKDTIDIKSDYNDSILGELESIFKPFIGLNKENVAYVSNRIKPAIITKIKEKILN